MIWRESSRSISGLHDTYVIVIGTVGYIIIVVDMSFVIIRSSREVSIPLCVILLRG